MFDQAALPLADTSDMIGLHQVFRDALGSSGRLVGTVEPGDTERAALVAGYYQNVLGLLHAHHEGEDELLTPKLLERAPDLAETIARISGQHQGVLAAIADAEALLTSWPTAPTADSTAALVDALQALDAQLTPHLDEEEQHILPIAAQHINVAEWGELPAHGMRNFGGDKLWLIFGLVQEQMSPEQIADMQAHIPPPVAQFWAETGQNQFNGYISELRR